MNPKWLEWARELQAVAQTGLNYGKDQYDIERFEQVREIAAEIMAAHAEVEFAIVKDLFGAESGHATPKIDVRGVVFQADKILLVRERSEGLWTLPGGWADVNISAAENAVKEVREESGYLTRPVKLLAVYDRNKHSHPPIPFHVYKFFFLCEIIGGEATHSYETDGVGFFAEDDLPPLSITRNTLAQIARMFEHYRHPEWPTDFD
jgi:ADP-ribose pyrophosphatase YjhB (NUDIX family)